MLSCKDIEIDESLRMSYAVPDVFTFNTMVPIRNKLCIFNLVVYEYIYSKYAYR